MHGRNNARDESQLVRLKKKVKTITAIKQVNNYYINISSDQATKSFI